MKHLLIIFLFCIAASTHAQKPTVIKITDLEKRIKANTDTTYIVNFWATWCVPCVKELPVFDSITTAYAGQKVKVLLVSIDFKENMKKQVIPFLKKKQLKPEVVLLDEVNGNYFIPKIDESWSGAIPATLIKNNAKGFHKLLEKEVTFEMIDAIVKSIP